VEGLTRRERLDTLVELHALHLAPIDSLHGAEIWQHDPRIVELKLRLERQFRRGLVPGPTDVDPDGIGSAFRALAAREPVPAIYDWLAEEATLDELIDFVSIEGGPDADFDDMVALCQVGLRGQAKLTLAANYWDEMGRGASAQVHSELYRVMVDALGIRSAPREELPDQALERKVLNGYLATNRALQPELVGALGLIECQAGARCRRVVRALRRLEVDAAAMPFYEEHATTDPRHGKDWIDGAVVPLACGRPDWASRMLRGAQWRADVNARFFAVMQRRFRVTSCAA
jgi:hypothetical protein